MNEDILERIIEREGGSIFVFFPFKPKFEQNKDKFEQETIAAWIEKVDTEEKNRIITAAIRYLRERKIENYWHSKGNLHFLGVPLRHLSKLIEFKNELCGYV